MINTNVTDDGFEICTPDSNLLAVPIGIEHVTCSFPNCGRVVKSTSALRLHMLKSHGVGKVTDKSVKKKKYACPVVGCLRHAMSQKKSYFNSMYLLKRHYLLCHGEKNFPCERCGRKFGTEMSSIQHYHQCRKLFYCSCGLNYSNKYLLKSHLLKNDRQQHHAVPDPDEEMEKEKEKHQREKATAAQNQMVTLPCFLYIPKDNTKELQHQQQQPSLTTNSQLIQYPDNATLQQNQERFIRILPKKQQRAHQEPFQFINPTQIAGYCTSMNPFQSLPHIFNVMNSSQLQPETSQQCKQRQLLPSSAPVQTLPTQTQQDPMLQTSSSLDCEKSTEKPIHKAKVKKPKVKKPKKSEPKKQKAKKVKIKESRFEKHMKFITSKETQEILADEELIQSTLSSLQNAKCNCALFKAGKVCRHFSPKKAAFIQKSNRPASENLITNFTQTMSTQAQATEQVHTGIQTNNDTQFPMVEVMETSDFSIQCRLSNTGVNSQDASTQDTSSMLPIPIIDNQTQTDDLVTLLDSLQTNAHLADMETQTYSAENDKSTLLDDILSGKTWDNEASIYVRETHNENNHIPSLFMTEGDTECKQNNSTQTLDAACGVAFDVYQNTTISDKDIVLPSQNNHFIEPLNMSFGTQTVFDDDSLSQETFSFGTQTGGFESNMFSSSATQTWDVSETSINAKTTIETQTAISFADLLDSSFIDEYLSTEQSTSTETQTPFDHNREVVTAETQTL